MFRRTPRSARRARRGAAMLELALVLPIFLTLTVGLIEFGRAFMVQQMLTAAAREGARYGSLPGIGNAEVEDRIRNYLSSGGIDTNVQIDVTPENLDSARSGTQVQVTVEVSFGDVTWIANPWFLRNATTLSSTTVMRHE